LIGSAAIFGDMSQSDQSVNAYQLRIVLRRTSPHLWRRFVVGSDSTLGQLHQTVQALFGWTDSHPHRFVLRGRSLGACSIPAAAALSTPDLPLSEFKLLLKERFFYDYRFHDVDVPVWRHEIRFEKALVADPERVPCCIGGVGNPPLEQSGSPQELSTLAELFTPQFVLHQLTELVDRGSSDAQLAQHLRHLRPWLTADRFSRKQANLRLQAGLAGAR
jgi:Plasmid pRiA4b ORF-3-like protein